MNIRNIERQVDLEELQREMNENQWSMPGEWNNLGCLYYNGLYRVQNYHKAKICFEKAYELDTTLQIPLTNIQTVNQRLNEAYSLLNQVDIFSACYNNKLENVKKMLAYAPQLIEAKYSESCPMTTQAASWILLGGKKIAAGFTGVFTLACLALLVPETAGASLTLASSASGATYALWKGYDKELWYHMKLRNGWTPLHFAAWGNATEVALLLIQRGANTTLLSSNGMRFSDLGQEVFNIKCNAEIVRLQQEQVASNNLRREHNLQRQLAQQLQIEQQARHQMQQQAIHVNNELNRLQQSLNVAERSAQNRYQEISRQQIQLDQQNEELTVIQNKLNQFRLFARDSQQGREFYVKMADSAQDRLVQLPTSRNHP